MLVVIIQAVVLLILIAMNDNGRCNARMLQPRNVHIVDSILLASLNQQQQQQQQQFADDEQVTDNQQWLGVNEDDADNMQDMNNNGNQNTWHETSVFVPMTDEQIIDWILGLSAEQIQFYGQGSHIRHQYIANSLDLTRHRSMKDYYSVDFASSLGLAISMNNANQALIINIVQDMTSLQLGFADNFLLKVAAYYSNTEVLQAIMDRPDVHIDNLYQLAILAAYRGSYEIVAYLLPRMDLQQSLYIEMPNLLQLNLITILAVFSSQIGSEYVLESAQNMGDAGRLNQFAVNWYVWQGDIDMVNQMVQLPEVVIDFKSIMVAVDGKQESMYDWLIQYCNHRSAQSDASFTTNDT